MLCERQTEGVAVSVLRVYKGVNVLFVRSLSKAVIVSSQIQDTVNHWNQEGTSCKHSLHCRISSLHGEEDAGLSSSRLNSLLEEIVSTLHFLCDGVSREVEQFQ